MFGHHGGLIALQGPVHWRGPDMMPRCDMRYI